MNNPSVVNDSTNTEYGTHTIGKKYTADFRVYITKNKRIISPIHSISAFDDKDRCVVNVVNEIPRFENAKFEINKGLSLNPVTQDIKKERLRFVKNLFPFKGYMWNYGAIPQTWEDKDAECEYTNCKGDNDPIDVLDISSIRKDIGSVYKAKVLGCLSLIDDNECDWKIIVIDKDDPIAERMNDISDVDVKYLDNTVKWLKNYKVPDGKPANKFGFDGRVLDKDFAMNIIEGAHESWKKLISQKHVDDFAYDEMGSEDVKVDTLLYDLPEECSAFTFVSYD